MDTNGHTTLCEDYVSFEVEELLEEKGFDKSYCTGYAPKSNSDGTCELISVCTLQMACKWLEIKKHIAIIPVLSSVLDNEKFLWDVGIVIAETGEKYSQGWVYENREQACEAALKYTLENLI